MILGQVVIKCTNHGWFQGLEVRMVAKTRFSENEGVGTVKGWGF